MGSSKPSENPPAERGCANRPDSEPTHGRRDSTPITPHSSPQGEGAAGSKSVADDEAGVVAWDPELHEAILEAFRQAS